MKALLPCSLLLFALAAPAFAGLEPGAVVTEGRSMAVVVDVDGDGLTDLIQDRDVLLNHGSGSFLEQSLGLTGNDLAIDWLDVNGDGRTDLLTKDESSAGPGGGAARIIYRVYLRDAQGKYSQKFVIPNDEAFPYIADANGDGRDDIVLLLPLFVDHRGSGTEVRVLISNGNGTFTSREPLRIGADPQILLFRHLPSGDLDRDGKPDLVIRTVEELAILHGTGGGDFTVETRYLPPQPFGFNYTALADADNDGNLDAVIAGFRTIRVFHGDGHGHFPRVSVVSIAKIHEAIVPSWAVIPHPPTVPAMTPDNINQPRLLAFGHFIANGRTEIAAPTGEGDIVVFAWQDGALREVGRRATEFLAPDVHAGAFYERGATDLYVTWNFGYPAARPQPRLLDAEPAAASPAPLRGSRSRAIRGSSARTTTLDVQVAGDCVSATDTWTLTRDGIFGVQRATDRVVETASEGNVLTFRTTATWAPATVRGEMTFNAGRYEGNVEMETACGWRTVAFAATPR